MIIGASGGIGKAIAELFGKEGAKVIAVAGHNKEKVQRIVENIRSIGGDALSMMCDISDEAQVERIVHKTLITYRRINILVNSTGIIGPTEPIEKIETDDWDRVFQINVKGMFLCAKHCIPVMVKQGHGNIINLSSTAGFRGSLISPCYSSSKGAIISLTKSLALAYAKKGIRINCISPGTIDTPMINAFLKEGRSESESEALCKKFLARHPIGRFGKAEEVAQGALYLASEVSSFVTGINLIIDGGISL